MNINELPDFLNRYNKARAKKTGRFVYHSVVIDAALSFPFTFTRSNEYGPDSLIYDATTFDALLEKMKKDIDGLT